MPRTGAAIELLAGSAWSDITADTYLRTPITITRGRQDVRSRVDPGTCVLTLNNKAGAYSPRNAESPLYGLIGRNTPIRVTTAAGSPFLRCTDESEPDARVSTPSAAAVQVTGDLDVRWDVEPADWDSGNITELGGKWGATGQQSWHAILFAGDLRFGWTTDGSTEVLAAVSVQAVVHPRRMCLRVTVDVNNGAGGRDVAFYSGPSMAGPWTQFGGTQTVAGTTATFSSTAPVEVGDVSSSGFPNAACRIYAFELRSGIGGVVVANPNFTAQTPGARSFVDGAGRTWTANNTTAISNRRTRYVGEMTSWPSRWDVTGGDVYVAAQARGIIRRLGQGADALQSTLRRRIPSDPNLIAYWPMEDGSGATSAYSPLPGVRPLLVSGFNFASDDSLAGSSALPQLNPPSSLVAPVPAAPSGDWRVEMVFRSSSVPALPSLMAQVNLAGSAAASVRFYAGVNVSRITVVDNSGAVLNTFDSTLPNFTDNWGRLQIFTSTSGSTVTVTAQWIVIGGPQNWFVSTVFTGGPGRVASIAGAWGTSFSDLRIGHIAVFNTPTTHIFDTADTGFDAEVADARTGRLAAEEGVPLLTPYGLAGDALMGPQRPDTLLNLLSEVADADLGILYEARDAIALAARPRVSLYNQPVALALNYSAQGEVAPPLEPEDDDAAVRNDVTRSRPNGSSARATLNAGALSTQAPPAGVGRYADAQALNVHSDDQLPDLAGWWLHLGTWDEARYPAVTVNLAAAPWLVDQVTAVEIGDRIQIANPPPWLAPGTIDLIVQGYTETIGAFEWSVTFNCTPAGPWTAGVLDDPVLGRADTDGSQLAVAVNTSATTLSVAVTAGPLWVTTAANPGEFPFDAVIGGEVVTVTGITGTASPQTWTVVRSVNDIHKSQAAGTDVRLATPMILSL